MMGAETCDEGVAGQLVGAKAEPEHSSWHSRMGVPHSIHRIPLPAAAVPDVNPCSLHLVIASEYALLCLVLI